MYEPQISFDDFKRYIQSIKSINDLQRDISDITIKFNHSNRNEVELYFPTLDCEVIDLLSILTHDTDGWISYWAFELNFGQDYIDGCVEDCYGNNIPLRTVEDLWNILKEEHKDMNITEVQQDLFLVPQGYYLAHCISGDYALGAGIAKKFDEVYNMRFKLHKNYPIPDGENYANVNQALLIDNVFNLVTKPRHWHKPSYSNIEATLEDMKRQCIEKDITKVAMPIIGCGLDRLQWNEVKEVIERVFEDTDIQIMVCRL